MNNKSVIVATLKGCSKCKKVVEDYNNTNINSINISCDDDPEMCDELEQLTSTIYYPIVVIKNKTNKINYIFYIKNDYNTSEQIQKIEDNAYKIQCSSLEELIEKSKKLYNEI